MNWESRGLVFAAGQGWLGTHASLPVAQHLSAGIHRVFFATRDDQGRSRVGSVVLDLDDPGAPQELSSGPILEPGPLGTFDDHGVYPASLVEDGGRLYLYTIGWNPGVRRPLFYASIGLAVSDDGGETFEKVSQAPILARSEYDPCLVTSPFVLKEGELWRMWYVSGFRWTEEADGLHSYYHVKYAESADGVSWERNGVVAVELLPGERNIARPCVLASRDGYRMWYSSDRGDGYRIGYAESDDGTTWRRRDDAAGVTPSGEEWDSEAQAYPWVIRRGEQLLMLYNGNGFGRDGIGLAVAHDDR